MQNYKKKFSGTFTAIITPFKENGEIDLQSFEKIIEHQIKNNIDGIVVLGTTGESPTVSPQEHIDLIKKTIEITKGRTLVIAGTGSNCTDEAIEYSQAAEKYGADAVLQVAPYYNKPTQKGLKEHFETIANSIDIPIILYNIKSRCGVNIETQTVVELSKIPNIIGVKEASGDLSQAEDVINKTSDDFIVLSGDDDQAIDLIKKGGDGVISVLSNILPLETKEYINLALDKNFELAKQYHKKYLNLIKNLFIETNPQPIKTLMAKEGFCKEIFRLPITTMTQENKEKLFESFNALKNNYSNTTI